MHIRANDYNYLVSLMSRRSLSPAAPEETKTAKKKGTCRFCSCLNTSVTGEANRRTREGTFSKIHLRPELNLYDHLMSASAPVSPRRRSLFRFRSCTRETGEGKVKSKEIKTVTSPRCGFSCVFQLLCIPLPALRRRVVL